MTEQAVDIIVPPGFNRIDTGFAVSGRFINGDQIRFVGDRAEKIGGWLKYFPTVLLGITRGMDAWVSLASIELVAMGSHCKLQLLKSGDTSQDITPIRATQAGLTDPFTTTSGSPIVAVNDVAHGGKQGDFVTYSGGTNPFNGLTIDGEYQITSVTDVDNYVITDDESATSSGAGGGTVTATYQITCGFVDAAVSVGYGVGGYGLEGYGDVRTIGNSTLIDPRIWSMAHYGEDLLAAPNGGTIYLFDLSVDTRAQVLTNAPALVNFVFVTPERFIFALGADEPMTVKWPDVDDNTDWTPTVTNTANERRLRGGAKLVSGEALTQGLSIVWSDSATFVFQYTGSSLVYSSRQVSKDVGIIAPWAFAVADGVAYWMSQHGFFMYDGSVHPIPYYEDIRDFVYDRLDESQQIKIACEYRARHNEIWWYYPSGGTENDSYVMVSLETMTWVTGTADVTATARRPSGAQRTLTTDASQFIHEHEAKGVVDADGGNLPYSLETGLVQLANGTRVSDIWGFLPDFKKLTGSCNLLIETFNRPQSAGLEDSATKAVLLTDEIVDFKVSGRLFKFILTGTDIGNDMRIGQPQILLDDAGARRA